MGEFEKYIMSMDYIKIIESICGDNSFYVLRNICEPVRHKRGAFIYMDESRKNKSFMNVKEVAYNSLYPKIIQKYLSDTFNIDINLFIDVMFKKRLEYKLAYKRTNNDYYLLLQLNCKKIINSIYGNINRKYFFSTVDSGIIIDIGKAIFSKILYDVERSGNIDKIILIDTDSIICYRDFNIEKYFKTAEPSFSFFVDTTIMRLDIGKNLKQRTIYRRY